MAAKNYHKDYWRKNRKKILARRRKRYASDPEYRDKAIARAERRRDQRRKQRERQTRGLRTAAEAAEQLAVNVHTIRSWGRKGYLPDPQVIANRHYYTRGQVKLMRRLARLLERLGWKVRTDEGAEEVEALRKEIAKQW